MIWLIYLKIAANTMTSIEEARHDLEHSVSTYLHCKSLISKTLDSIEDCKSVTSETFCSIEETLKFQKQQFENALKGLNRSHTIWRCRSDDSNLDTSSDSYSSTWLENEWEEHCALDDQADEFLYTHSLNICSCPLSAYDVAFDIPVSVSDVSNTLIETTDIPVPVLDASSTLNVASEVPVVVSDASSNLSVASDIPVLVLDVSSSLTVASGIPVLVPDVSSNLTVASNIPVSVTDVSNDLTVTSKIPVLVSSGSSTLTVASDIPVSVTGVSNNLTAASDIPVLVSNTSSNLNVTSDIPVSVSAGSSTLTVASDVSVLATDVSNMSDNADLSATNVADYIVKSSVDATTSGCASEVTEVTVQATLIVNSPCVMTPAALFKLSRILKPPDVPSNIALLVALLYSFILKKLNFRSNFSERVRGM